MAKPRAKLLEHDNCNAQSICDIRDVPSQDSESHLTITVFDSWLGGLSINGLQCQILVSNLRPKLCHFLLPVESSSSKTKILSSKKLRVWTASKIYHWNSKVHDLSTSSFLHFPVFLSQQSQMQKQTIQILQTPKPLQGWFENLKENLFAA